MKNNCSLAKKLPQNDLENVEKTEMILVLQFFINFVHTFLKFPERLHEFDYSVNFCGEKVAVFCFLNALEWHQISRKIEKFQFSNVLEQLLYLQF